MSERIAHVTTGISYAVSGGTVLFAGLSQAEWTIIGIISGIVLGVLTYLTSLFFKYKLYKLERRRIRRE